MGEKRKLQGEIDRCLKKVTEGVELFDEIFEKFHAAPQQNQKEKFEADLKKEIKKLQRLRDQIKGWLSSNNVKDKQLLQDNRKLIETQMERFKAVERETKTKAFSKSGLTAEQKLDPKEREREEMRTWLQDSIDRINQQNDQFESEIESLEAMAGKKKKLEKEKQDKVDECRHHLERHKFHVQRLELLLRLLDNATVDPTQIKDIREDVEYYIENCMDPDFEENEYMYDEFNLDFNELSQQLGNVAGAGGEEMEAGNSETGTTASTTSTAPSPGPLPTTRESSGSKEPEEKSRHASGEESVRIVKPTVNRANSISRSTPTTPFKQSSVDISTTGSQLPPVTTPPLIPNVPYNSVAAGIKNASRAATATPAANSTVFKTTESVNDIVAPVAIQSPAKQPQAAAVVQRAESTPPSIPEQIQNHPAAVIPQPPFVGLVQLVSVSRETTPALPPTQPSPFLHTTTQSAVSEALATSGDLDSEYQISQQQATLNQQQQQQAQLQAAVSGSFGQQRSQQQQQVSSVGPNSSWPPQATNQQQEVSSLTSTLQQQFPNALSAVLQQQQAPATQFSAIPSSVVNNTLSSAVATAQRMQTPLAPAGPVGPPAMNGPADIQKDNVDSLRLMAQQVISAGTAMGNLPLSQQNMGSGTSAMAGLRPFANIPSSLMLQLMPQSGREQEAKVTPHLGASPLGKLPLSHVVDSPIFQILDAASNHLPQPADSERVKVYLPRTPAPTPPYYPQHDSLVGFYDTLDYYQRLTPEALFFTFYYMEGTKAQYLAATALKKQSWRFHTKYKMWFQRHEEPKTITDDFEMGTYIYFDFERWAQRRKEGFTFEYRYLEDKEL